MYLIPSLIPIIIAFISSYIFVGWVLCSTAFGFYRWKIPVTTIWLAVVIVCFVAWVKLMGVTFSMPATVSFAAVFIVCWVAFFLVGGENMRAKTLHILCCIMFSIAAVSNLAALISSGNVTVIRVLTTALTFACAILAIAVAVDKREHKKLTCFGISMIAMAVLFISSMTYATIIDMHTVHEVKFTCSDQQYVELAKTGYNLEPTDNPNEYICTGRHS